jgi:hypothetical protein
MAKWLSKYEQGGQVLKKKTKDNYGKKPNPNEVDASVGPDFVGMGNNLKGRDYSPAWGGQFEDGGGIPKAQGGFKNALGFPGSGLDLVTPATKIANWFSDDKSANKQAEKQTDAVPKKGVNTIKINDPRKIRMTTGKPLRPNSDLVGGTYTTELLDPVLQTAIGRGLSKDQVWDIASKAFQETKFGHPFRRTQKEIDTKLDYNIGHTKGMWGADNWNDAFVNAYLENMKIADRKGLKDPAMRLQVFNGLGNLYPDTEKSYHHGNSAMFYGVPVPKTGLSMSENPLYGKQIIDMEENVLKKNPAFVRYIDSIYSSPVPSKFKKTKKAMGGSIPGAVGFTYARTAGAAPSNGKYAKKTKASAQDGKAVEPASPLETVKPSNEKLIDFNTYDPAFFNVFEKDLDRFKNNDFDSVKQTIAGYVNSPTYARRLSTFVPDSKKAEDIKNARLNSLLNTTFKTHSTDLRGPYYSNDDNSINISDYVFNDRGILSHEFGHSLNPKSRRRLDSNFTKEEIGRLTAPFTVDKLKEMYPADQSINWGYTPFKDPHYVPQSKSLYDKTRAASETYGDLTGMRQILLDNGITSEFGQDITPEMWEKALQNSKVKENPTFKRLKLKYKDEDIIKLNNEVAYNRVNNPSVDRAQDGKDIPKGMTLPTVNVTSSIKDYNIRKLAEQNRETIGPVKPLSEYTPEARRIAEEFNQQYQDYSKQREKEFNQKYNHDSWDYHLNHLKNSAFTDWKPYAAAAAVYGAPAVSSALGLGSTMTALSTPIIGGFTGGNILGALSIAKGANSISNTSESVMNAYNNPTTDNIIKAIGDVGWNLFDLSPGIPVVRAVGQEVKPLIDEAKSAYNTYSNLKDLNYAKKVYGPLGYEIPENLKRIAKSNVLTDRTIKGLVTRDNTFYRGVTTDWDMLKGRLMSGYGEEEGTRRFNEFLEVLKNKGIDPYTNPKAAAEYMATHIPLSNAGFGRSRVSNDILHKAQLDALYSSNSQKLPEGYTYGNGYVIRATKPLDFSSASRKKWINSNIPSVTYSPKGIELSDINQPIQTFKTDFVPNSGVSHSYENFKQLQKLGELQLKDELPSWNVEGSEDAKVFNQTLDDLRGASFTREREIEAELEKNVKALQEKRNAINNKYDKYFDNSSSKQKRIATFLTSPKMWKDAILDQHYYNQIANLRKIARSPEVLSKAMFEPWIERFPKIIENYDPYNQTYPFGHYLHVGPPGTKVLNPAFTKQITPENWKHLSRDHANEYTRKATRREDGGEISKNGSVIKDDMGQWAHPGEITEIGSNDITMEGVDYPVLGISDTGDVKLMQPDQNYKFKGNKVTEFPMMNNGGWLDKYTDKAQNGKGYVSMKNNKDWFDSHANWSNTGNKQYDDFVRKSVLSGRFGVDPKTGDLIKLKESEWTDVSDMEKTLAKDKRNWTKKEKQEAGDLFNSMTPEGKQFRKDVVAGDLQNMFKNPLFYAPAAIAAAPFVAGAASTAAPILGAAMEAPMFGVAGLTGTNVMNAGFAYEAAKNLPNVASSITTAYQNPTWSNIGNAALETGVTALDALPFAAEVTKGAKYLKTLNNSANVSNKIKAIGSTENAINSVAPMEESASKHLYNPVTGETLQYDANGNIISTSRILTDEEIIKHNREMRGIQHTGYTPPPPEGMEPYLLEEELVDDGSHYTILDDNGNIVEPSKFTSEIDWGKWNKKITQKKKLLGEYHDIEQAAKQNGTWMKNADGTPFTLPNGELGTPEQFVIERSSAFKKSYPNGYDVVYRGGAQHHPTLRSTILPNSGSKKPIFGELSEGNKHLAEFYAGKKKGTATYYDQSMPTAEQRLETFIRNNPEFNKKYVGENGKVNLNNFVNDYPSLSIGVSAGDEGGIYQLIVPKTNKKIVIDAEGSQWHSIDDPKVYQQLKDEGIPITRKSLKGKVAGTEKFETDNVADLIEKKGLNRAEIYNVIDGPKEAGNVIINNQIPGNYLKSFRGNAGEYNLNLRNIYKTMIPAVGIGALKAVGSSKEKEKNGGWLNKYK